MDRVIVKATAAKTADIDIIDNGRGTTFQLYGTGDIGATASEYVEFILRGYDDTDADIEAIDDGVAVRLDADNTHKTIYGNLRATLSKTITANAVGVLRV